MSKHDQLQAQAYQWANNTFPQIRGHLFAARSEVVRYPGESERAFLARLSHLKTIGHRKGILDLHLDMPKTKDNPFAAPYEFDAKVKPDYLKPDQLERIELLRRCGGDGWAFFSFEEFKRIFMAVMGHHFGAELVIMDPLNISGIAGKSDKENRRKWIDEMRRKI